MAPEALGPQFRSPADLAAQARQVAANNAKSKSSFVAKHGKKVLADIRREKAVERAKDI